MSEEAATDDELDGEEEVSGKSGAQTEAGTAQRFKSAFTITQA